MTQNFITPEIIKAFTIAGQPAEMVEQIRELESYGRDGINIIAPLDQQYQLIEDFAYNVMSKKVSKGDCQWEFLFYIS
tara:strand:+ start:382 stop:615 length:234 start_codon:yes stop_codon:yes gene_type:complete